MTNIPTLELGTIDASDLAAAAREVGATGPMGFHVDDRGFTYRVAGSSFEVVEGLDTAATVVAMAAPAWDDFVAQTRTFINLFLAKELTFERGGFADLTDWDPALKLVHAGIPVYDPARADLSDIDFERRYSLDDSDADLRAFLTATGVLHVRGVFTADEMAAANAEVDRLAAMARPGDDQSWWASDESGAEVLCRLVYTTLRSEALAAFESDPRVRRLGTVLDPSLRPATDRMEGSSVLLKVPGSTQGLSNIPWHQDCGMGGHSIYCPSAAVGIQLTGSSAATGNLHVVPGSHGQTLHYRWQERLADVPVLAIDTEPGDCTVHIKDVMHASPQPTGEGGRRTMYVSSFPAALWDNVGPGEAFNDLVRNRTREAGSLFQ